MITFDDHVRLFGCLESIASVDFLVNSSAEVDVDSVKTLGSTDTAGDLTRCLEALAARDFDVIVVDLTQPDVAALGFSVVKVLVPGLVDIHADHNYPFLGGKRLYTVPQILGYVDGEVREEALNPFPHPFP